MALARRSVLRALLAGAAIAVLAVALAFLWRLDEASGGVAETARRSALTIEREATAAVAAAIGLASARGDLEREAAQDRLIGHLAFLRQIVSSNDPPAPVPTLAVSELSRRLGTLIDDLDQIPTQRVTPTVQTARAAALAEMVRGPLRGSIV